MYTLNEIKSILAKAKPALQQKYPLNINRGVTF